MSSITLSQQEIEEITGLKKPTFQMRFLKMIGIKAVKRPDNSVLVMRYDLAAAKEQPQQPQLKSSRK